MSEKDPFARGYDSIQELCEALGYKEKEGKLVHDNGDTIDPTIIPGHSVALFAAKLKQHWEAKGWLSEMIEEGFISCKESLERLGENVFICHQEKDFVSMPASTRASLEIYIQRDVEKAQPTPDIHAEVDGTMQPTEKPMRHQAAIKIHAEVDGTMQPTEKPMRHQAAIEAMWESISRNPPLLDFNGITYGYIKDGRVVPIWYSEVDKVLNPEDTDHLALCISDDESEDGESED